jgi:hypothetical protein
LQYAGPAPRPLLARPRPGRSPFAGRSAAAAPAGSKLTAHQSRAAPKCDPEAGVRPLAGPATSTAAPAPAVRAEARPPVAATAAAPPSDEIALPGRARTPKHALATEPGRTRQPRDPVPPSVSRRPGRSPFAGRFPAVVPLDGGSPPPVAAPRRSKTPPPGSSTRRSRRSRGPPTTVPGDLVRGSAPRRPGRSPFAGRFHLGPLPEGTRFFGPAAPPRRNAASGLARAPVPIAPASVTGSGFDLGAEALMPSPGPGMTWGPKPSRPARLQT